VPFSFQDPVPLTGQNGVQTVFTLPAAPNPTGSLQLTCNGLLLEQGVDYTLAGATVTFNRPPLATDVLLASYRTWN
jgi:hypothetical protein